MLDELTTEHIRKKFKNNFDLCNFAINIARGLLMNAEPMTLDEILLAIDKRASEERG